MYKHANQTHPTVRSALDTVDRLVRKEERKAARRKKEGRKAAGKEEGEPASKQASKVGSERGGGGWAAQEEQEGVLHLLSRNFQSGGEEGQKSRKENIIKQIADYNSRGPWLSKHYRPPMCSAVKL